MLEDEAGLIQGRLWRAAVAAAEADSQSVPAGLFAQAMNELIDLKGERDAVLAMGVVGYENGYAGARTLGVTTLLCALTNPGHPGHRRSRTSPSRADPCQPGEHGQPPEEP